MAKNPKNLFYPGEMLLGEFLVPMGMSQAEFARQLNWTKARLNELIRVERGITPNPHWIFPKRWGPLPNYG